MRQPNLMLGVGAVVAAAVLAIVFRPAMSPPPMTRTRTVVEGPPPIELQNPDVPRQALPTRPVTQPTAPKTATTPVAATPVNGEMPLRGRILENYGFVFEPSIDEWDFHPAWDIAGKIGESVHAAFAGVVSAVGPDPALGLTVTIRSGKLSATYAGLQDTSLTVGTRVQEGEVIGAVGKAGPLEAGEGAHLHFGLTESGQPVNPATLVKPS